MFAGFAEVFDGFYGIFFAMVVIFFGNVEIISNFEGIKAITVEKIPFGWRRRIGLRNLFDEARTDLELWAECLDAGGFALEFAAAFVGGEVAVIDGKGGWVVRKPDRYWRST